MEAAVSVPPRLLVLTGFPAIGGPLPKLVPLMVEGFREGGFEVAIEGWSAHTAGHESLPAKVVGRSCDLLRVQRRIDTWRPDVVYVATTHNWPAMMRDLALALSVPRRRPPLVLHLHGSESHLLVAPGHAALKRATHLLMDRVDAVLLLSTEELGEWRRFRPQTRYDVVLNPFVPAGGEPAHVKTGGTPTVLCIARLVPAKGVLDLLDAFALLRRRRPCRLVIAGRGPARDDISRRACLLGVSDSVSLPGYVSGARLDAVYRGADIFTLPSYFEGFPLTVMEAMGYGLPIVTTRIRGCADNLTEGVNALFVPPRDPETLADTLQRLLDDESLRYAMGEANREKVRDFAPDKVLPRYVDILRDVVQGAGA